MTAPRQELPLFSHWLDVAGAILERAGRFPKGLRPTLGNRLIDRALEVMDHIVELRYTRDRAALFRRANLALEQTRILVRISFERRLLSARQFEHLAEAINTAGRMLGGWRKAEAERAP